LRSQKIIKDIIIVGIIVLVIWIGIQVIFGTPNPFYVVSSGSMLPVLQVYDVIVVQGNTTFEDVERGDIIVFFSPAKYERGEERVIVHRVDLIMEDDPKIVRTRGDNNPKSISGTDFPITEREYIGKVEYIIPHVGYITQILQPPVNYIIIAIIIGVMIAKHFLGNKQDEITFQHTKRKDDTEIEDNVFTLTHDEIKSENDDIVDIKLDKEYVEKSDATEEFKLKDSEDPKIDEDKK
jgi:signal peptidase